MGSRAARQGSGEQGFTLIELLVVILIIGILAAIAIPTLLNQQSKAVDASGKETARGAAQAAETYATDHNDYTGLERPVIHEYEPALQIEEGNNRAFVSVAEAVEEGKGFKVTATAGNGDTFTFEKNASGEVTRTCTAASATQKGGCQTGSW